MKVRVWNSGAVQDVLLEKKDRSLEVKPGLVYPNHGDFGYGRFLLDPASVEAALAPGFEAGSTLLEAQLAEAGIDRKRSYVTNAVKHFNWEEQRGKRRIHKKPGARQVAACQPWLAAEIAVVRARVIVALGATASLSLMGRDFRLTQHRGEPMESQWGSPVVATVHPSSILRARDEDEREVARAAFVDDLRRVAEMVSGRRAA